jgi:HlyD family secretion protein
MRKIIFPLSFLGLVGGLWVAYLSGKTQPAQPPAFSPATNPYPSAIYANGILESDQPSGENINIYPEVPGTVKRILVSEGQQVKKGAPLLVLDDSIQKATVEQQKSQADASSTLLDELKAQPRPEALEIALAQVGATEATLKTAQDALDKQKAAYDLDPKSISKDALDNAANAVAVASANRDVARRQLELTKAGAWTYDIRTQERQHAALEKAYAASSALLAKYTLLAPRDGVVMAVQAMEGSYISAQGSYDSYTQGMTPVIVLGSAHDHLNVRCYVDEILLPRVPIASKIKAQMTVRGSTLKLPLEFVRVQPFVSPKIELSNQRLERVDVRVLPIIFRVEKPKDLNLYPGQLVDVYIGD